MAQFRSLIESLNLMFTAATSSVEARRPRLEPAVEEVRVAQGDGPGPVILATRPAEERP